MTAPQRVTATSGGLEDVFVLEWDERRWSCSRTYEMADFPFIAEIGERRYELYSDGTFDEEELPADAPPDLQ